MSRKNWVPCICLIPYKLEKYESMHKVGTRLFIHQNGSISIQNCGCCKGKGYLTQDDLDETIEQYKKIWCSELTLIKKNGGLNKLYRKYPKLRNGKSNES